MEKREVVLNVQKYFQENLPAYEVVEIRKKSEYEDDSYLYMVAGKKNSGEYAVWTCWNEKIQSLNYGHYNIKDLETCHKIMNEFYCSKS